MKKSERKVPFRPPTSEEVETYFDRLVPMARLHKDGTVTYSVPLESVKPPSPELLEHQARLRQIGKEWEEEMDEILNRLKAPSAKQRTNLAEVDKRSLIEVPHRGLFFPDKISEIYGSTILLVPILQLCHIVHLG